MMNPFGEGYFPTRTHIAWKPKKPGKYRIKFYYDSSGADKLWLTFWGKRKKKDLQIIKNLLKKVPRVKIESNEIVIEIKPKDPN